MQTQPAELKGNNKDILQAPALPGTINQAVVTTTNLSKIYGKGASAVEALNGVSLEIGHAQFTAIMGPSGSGKSTLMHCLAGLDTASSGSIMLDGSELTKMKDRQLTRLRRDKIGFIFQSFNLVPTLTAKENITLPADIAGKKISETRLRSVINAVGLEDRLSHHPAELSGGQQQRVACARALLTQPAVIFADEPTGNLDSESTGQILEFLRHAVDDFQQTVVMVTHDVEVAAWADRVIFLVDGRVAAELLSPTRETVLDALRELGDPQSKWVQRPPLTSPTIVEPDHSASALLARPGEEDNLPEHRPFHWEPPALTGQIPLNQTEISQARTETRLSQTETQMAKTTDQPMGASLAASTIESDIDQGKTENDNAADTNNFESATETLPQTRPTVQHEEREGGAVSEVPAESALPPPQLVPLEEVLEQIAPAQPLPERTSRVIDQAQQILEELHGSVLDSAPNPQPKSTSGQQGH